MARQNLAFAGGDFKRHLGIAILRNKKRIAEEIKDAVNWVFDEVTAAAPQWSGHMVSNFSVSIAGQDPDGGATELYVENWRGMMGGKPRPPAKSGDHLAIDIATRRNSWALHSHEYDPKDTILFSFGLSGYGPPDDPRAANYQGDVFQRMSMFIKVDYKGQGQYWNGGDL